MSQKATLQHYGWTPKLEAEWQRVKVSDTLPGRVVADFGNYLKVATPKEYNATIAGKLRHELTSDQLPKVGDWVSIRPEDEELAVIQAVLPRTSSVDRKVNADRPEKQVLAANVDIAFVVQSLNEDFNLARLDRYVYQLKKSHIVPYFVFNKRDLLEDTNVILQKIEQAEIAYIFTNAITGEGIDRIKNLLKDGLTAVFLGSSGVGKSTLTNQLLGSDRQKTAAVREKDAKGRHTTSHRELFLVPAGGIIIDTPGIRELQLWGEEGSLEATFPDIIALALKCQFRNCQHTTQEKGCAVQQAIRQKQLSLERFESYAKLKEELRRSTTY